ncbi:MAG: ABC transporter ATP-binding protein, partial [Nitrosomonas sp.]|nr:ABC transporter ATP-binding protein [Nitrosomonas sp.]
DVELRQTLWDFIKQLNQDGHTIVLTTHYLEEAETLCHRVAMLKEGKIVALDSTKNLIGKMIAGKSVRLRLVPDRLPPTLQPLQISHHDGIAELRIENYAQVEFILSSLRVADIQILEMHLQQPDLEDVFVSIMRKSGSQSK